MAKHNLTQCGAGSIIESNPNNDDFGQFTISFSNLHSISSFAPCETVALVNENDNDGALKAIFQAAFGTNNDLEKTLAIVCEHYGLNSEKEENNSLSSKINESRKLSI